MNFKFKIGDLVYRKFEFDDNSAARKRNVGLILERRIEKDIILYKVLWLDVNKEYLYAEYNLEILSES